MSTLSLFHLKAHDDPLANLTRVTIGWGRLLVKALRSRQKGGPSLKAESHTGKARTPTRRPRAGRAPAVLRAALQLCTLTYETLTVNNVSATLQQFYLVS